MPKVCFSRHLRACVAGEIGCRTRGVVPAYSWNCPVFSTAPVQTGFCLLLSRQDKHDRSNYRLIKLCSVKEHTCASRFSARATRSVAAAGATVAILLRPVTLASCSTVGLPHC